MTMQSASVSSIIYVTCSHQNHIITKSDNGEYVHDYQFCGQRWIEPLCDHTNCQWEVTTPCTESENGLISKCCKDCNYIIENKELPAGSHFDVKSNENLKISNMLIKGSEQGIVDILEHFDFSGYDVTIAETENRLGTGSQINLSLENETIFTYYIVIDGDITGDGFLDATDLAYILCIANYE